MDGQGPPRHGHSRAPRAPNMQNEEANTPSHRTIPLDTYHATGIYQDHLRDTGFSEPAERFGSYRPAPALDIHMTGVQALPAWSMPGTPGLAAVAIHQPVLPTRQPHYSEGHYDQAPGANTWQDGDLATSGWSPSSSVDNISHSQAGPSRTYHNAPQGGRRDLQRHGHQQRHSSSRDEFDGPLQFLQRPLPEEEILQDRELPALPTNLLGWEQDSVLTQVNDCLSKCAFDFFARYQFPIPITEDTRTVERPQDREWNEWVYLLKRLATKRRIPARLLYNGQIKQFITVLENSLEMRHAAKHQSRPLKDDRNVLQLISAGLQVAKILKNAQAMEALDFLYISTEIKTRDRIAAAAAGLPMV